ncbi:uncharacterized protein LOC126370596 [Pectinophora gossypiella]|uniref:uncharacterized protein LOC126370596 n=1 Tax=Pectinophora gossypiella TaxID=13191 RepID=UPI00214E33B2|nr:uncharacterized protein LOC126370596 [Pectinophora gossypiella]
MSSVDEKPPTDASTKLREMRNTDLVSRLLAATPPYLYSALPLQPHAFFFSEMLRSFVSARHGCRPPHYHRRFKRRSHKYFAENDNDWRREYPKEDEKKEPEIRPEVPLELTVDKQPRVREPSPKVETNKRSSPSPQERQSTFVDVGTEELPKPSPCVRSPAENPVQPSNLILPPPPPMWYPPLYNPQFGVDPLNFFIDLRVQGHIYDRKRLAEGMETNISQEVRSEDSGLDKRLGRDFGQRPRHLSAFSVPVRSGNITVDGPDKYFDHPSRGGKTNGTSYIMKNLKRVYENVHSQEDRDESKDEKAEETKAESSDVDDDIID